MKTSYETAITANTAGNTELLTNELKGRVQAIQSEIDLTVQRTRGQDISNQQAQALMPLLLELQRLENTAAELGIPELEASASYWGTAGAVGKALSNMGEAGGAINAVRQLLDRRAKQSATSGRSSSTTPNSKKRSTRPATQRKRDANGRFTK